MKCSVLFVLFYSIPHAMFTPGGIVYLQYQPALNILNALTKLKG